MVSRCSLWIFSEGVIPSSPQKKEKQKLRFIFFSIPITASRWITDDTARRTTKTTDKNTKQSESEGDNGGKQSAAINGLAKKSIINSFLELEEIGKECPKFLHTCVRAASFDLRKQRNVWEGTHSVTTFGNYAPNLSDMKPSLTFESSPFEMCILLHVLYVRHKHLAEWSLPAFVRKV